MSPPLSRRRLLALGTLAVVSSLSGCLSSVRSDWGDPGTHVQSDDRSDDELGLAYSKSSGSFTDESESETDWIHIVSDGKSADLTFNARLCDSLGEITPSLSNPHSTEYVLDFATTSTFTTATSTTSSNTDSCQSGTHLTGGANVPSDWETLVVTVDGTRIQSLERSGTTPELRSLPDPIGRSDGQIDESNSPAGVSGISNEEAAERALAAEEVYIRSQLKEASCTESWGLESYTGVETEATVSDRTADGVRVSVTHPYWYSTAATEADGSSRATYLVTAEGIQRVEGDRIIRC